MLSSSMQEEIAPYVGVQMATQETHLSVAMLTLAHRVLVEQMLIVSPTETELCASVGRGMREIHLSTAF